MVPPLYVLFSHTVQQLQDQGRVNIARLHRYLVPLFICIERVDNPYDQGAILKYIQTQWTGVETTGADKNKLTAFAVAEVVTGSPSTSTGTIASLTNPEIDYYSGNIIYAEDRSPITRATDQTENIKLIVEF